MPKSADSFHDFVRELWADLKPIEIKSMFGGAGVFRDGVMFAMVIDDTLWLKVDDAFKKELKAEGSKPFIWEPKTGPRVGEKIDLGYWRLPEASLDEPDEAVKWGRKALKIAQAKAASKKAKPKRAAKKALAKKKR